MSRMPEVVPAFPDSPTLALTGRTRLLSTQLKSAVKLLSDTYIKTLNKPNLAPKRPNSSSE